MNTNEIRFYLHNYEKLKSEIQVLSDSLKEYRLMDGVKSQQITDMPICHSGTSVIESIVVNRFDYIKDLEEEIDSKMRVLNAINAVYFYLKEPARSIIEMRYFLYKNPGDVRHEKYNWQEIAEHMGYSENHCMKIDWKVINKIQYKMLNK